MDYTVHGILQARILEWVAFSFSRGSSQPRDPTQVSHIAGGMTIQAWSKSNHLLLYSGSDKQSQGIRLDRRTARGTEASWYFTGGNDQHPQEREIQKGKVFVWGGLTNSWVKKRSERQRRKGKIYPFECRVPKNSKEGWKKPSKWTMQRNRGKQ